MDDATGTGHEDTLRTAPRARNDAADPDPASGRNVERAVRRGWHLLVLRALQFGLAFLGGVIVTRQLGPSGRAEYALPLTFASMAWVVAHLSVEGSAQRMLGRREATLNEMARFLSAATLAMSVVAVPLCIAVGFAVRGAILADASKMSVVLAALTIPFTLAAQMAAALLFRIGALRAYGVTVVVSGAVQLALAVGFSLAASITPEVALLIALSAIAVSALGMCAALARHTGLAALAPRTNRRTAKAALGVGLRLHVSSIALYLNLQIDLLLVAALTDTHEAGLYSLSATLAAMLFVATSTFALAGLQTQTDAEESVAIRYTAILARQTLAISVLLAIVACVFAYPFILVAYGSAWLPSAVPFMILSIAAVALGVESPARNLLMRVGSPTTISAASLVALVLNVLLNLVLIPYIGIAGAALASVASYWAATLLMLWLLHRETGTPVTVFLSWPARDEPFRTLSRRAAAVRFGRRRVVQRPGDAGTGGD